jgi:hypothetical protein
LDASDVDASVGDAAAADSSIGDADASAMDATMSDAAGGPNDGAMEGGMDGGLMDGAMSDASEVDSGPAPLCPERSDALFCDGFEDPSFSRWSYNLITNGTLDQSTARVKSGATSLRATTGAAGSTNVARYGAKVFAHQKSGDIWVRYFYFVPGSTVVNTAFSTAVVAEIEPPYFGFALLVVPSRVDIGVFDTMYQGTMAFPRDKWICVELHVQIDATAGIFEAYLDGALAVRSPATKTLPDMGYTSLDVGIHYTDIAQGPVEAYADDVVAGTKRLGCK